MKLTNYLHKLSSDKNIPVDDRLLYLYDTKDNIYLTKLLLVTYVDTDGPIYRFADGDDPFHNFKYLNVIRAYTITNCLNVMMGLESLQGNYGESEVSL